MTQAPVAAPSGPGRRVVVAWALYDLANTIYSMNVVSLYFALWVVRDAGGTDGAYGVANSFSQALVFVSAPLIGALSDQVPRRVPLLVATTIVCCVATALLGTWGLSTIRACIRECKRNASTNAA